jgi:hypothetical protein
MTLGALFFSALGVIHDHVSSWRRLSHANAHT